MAATARERTEAGRAASLASRIGREPWLVALVAVTAVADSVYSIIRHDHFGSGVDLAIFDQVVWRYSHFQAPFSSIKGEDILGDHFHPLVAVLAPLYWVWSNPRMLLIAQAILVAVSIVAVFLFARDRIGRGAAYALAVAYAVFWGIQVGVGFEFHELAFAPLLIACAILFLDRRQWGRFWIAIGLLLLVKEDLALLVVFFGVYVLTLREWRHGAALVIVGVAWFELTTKVFIPDLSAHGSYSYWSYGELGKNLPSALFALVKGPWRVFTIGLGNSEKRLTILALFGPFLCLSIYSRLFLLAIPLLAERFLSGDSMYWATAFQYSLAISPILAMGAADGIRNASRWLPARARRPVILGTAMAMLAANLVVTSALNTRNAINSLPRQSFYAAPSFERVVSAALARVPPNASVAVTDVLAPHLSERNDIRVLGDSASMPQYVVFDTVAPFGNGAGQSETPTQLGTFVDRWLPRMTAIFYSDGWLVARAEPPGRPAGNGVFSPMPASSSNAIKSAAASWNASLNRVNTHLFTCLAKRQPVSCYASVPSGIQLRARELTSAIGGAFPTLHGGCSQLGAVAETGIQRLARDYELMITAARSGSTPPFRNAFVKLEIYYQTADPVGRVARLTLLCSRRA